MKKGLTYYLITGMFLSLAAFFGTGSAHAQTVGYLYPAGGQQGTTFEMLVAGAGIGGGREVIVTGGGVDIKILERPRYGDFLHQDPYGGKCVAIWRAMMDEESRIFSKRDNPEEMDRARESLRENRRKRTEAIPTKSNEIPTPTDEEVFRSSVYWHKLRKPTLADMQLLWYEYDGGVISTNQKRHSSFGSTLMTSVTIAPDAKPGIRELYVVTSGGLSRAIKFWVSNVNEVKEIEPNEVPIWTGFKNLFKTYVEQEPQEIPVVINGQIKPGDIDKHEIICKKGQQLVFDVQARTTAPYIANAVPGWFCAIIALYDKDGNRLKYCENYRFDQNPMMFYRIPEDGKYTVLIQDSIFRGRNDFVYRLSIGEFPVVFAQFPLGGKLNETTTINLLGGNLPSRKITPDFKGENIYYEEVREINEIDGIQLIRPLRYMVETLPIFLQPLGSRTASPYSADYSKGKAPIPIAQRPANQVTLPIVVYGRIKEPGDVGIYQFQGKKDQQVALDVTAQQLGSALDAVVELRDSTGKVIAMNDDRAGAKGPNIGTEVTHSDPNVVATLPADGTYTVRIFNVFRRGGQEYFYRLRISEPHPDFDVVLIPSRLRFNGKSASFTVNVFRKEGFKGEIQLRAVGDCSHMTISKNGIIKANEDTTTFSIVTEKKLPSNPYPIDIRAESKFPNGTVSNKVHPSDDWEQAFIYHHWLPARQLMATQR